MIVKDLLGNGFRLICGDEQREIRGCYIGDLLSLAMSRIQKDNAWITIQSNINIVAVASLMEAGCIIICDGFSPDDGVIQRADIQEVTILRTELSAYEVAKILSKYEI
ncbi:MAG: AraC family transcriptional regulator [Clostridia bacterium]|nr:AraC family transcriptional regulator [Clostridia bacterium]